MADDGREFQVPWTELRVRQNTPRKAAIDDESQKRQQFLPEDSVSFLYRGAEMQGIVQNLGYRRALVRRSDDSELRVPYSILKSAMCTREIRRRRDRLAMVDELAYTLLAEHGLAHWLFHFDQSTARAGVCKFGDRVVALSHIFSVLSSEEEVRDALLHEIAHALVGPEHGHDETWRAKATKIGCNGSRLTKQLDVASRYLVSCPRCKWMQKTQKRHRNAVCLKCRGPALYQPFSRDLWSKHDGPA